MIKIRRLVPLLILCTCYAVSYSQAFESKLGGLVDADIGNPLLVTNDGITIFGACDYAKGEIFLSAYNENHHPLYIRKKLNFNKIKNVENILNSMLAMRNLYSKASYKTMQILGDMYQSTRSVYFDLSEKNHSYTVEVDYLKGVIVTEIEKDYRNNGIPENRAYNLLKTKYAKVVSTRISEDKEEYKLLVYDANDVLIDECKLLDGYYNSYEFLLFDNDAIFIGQYRAKTLKTIKYDLLNKKSIARDIDLSTVQGTLSKFHKNVVVDNVVDNSLDAYWVIYEKGKDKYHFMYSRIDKTDFNYSTAKELEFSKMKQYLKSNELKINLPMIINFAPDGLGNTLLMMLRDDFEVSATGSSPLAISCFNKKGEEIYGSAYKFKVRGEDEMNFIENITPLKAGKKSLIFLNDIPENFNLKPLDKHTRITTRMGQKPIAVELDEVGNMEQYFVFGTKENQEESSYIEFRSSYYDKKANRLIATMYIDSWGGNSKPVWIKLK